MSPIATDAHDFPFIRRDRCIYAEKKGTYKMRFKSSCSGIIAAGFALAAIAFSSHAATLPAEYIQLEYIEGTGTQWINTGYTPQSTDTIEVEVEFSKVNSNQAFWCARKGGADSTFTFFWLTGGLRFDYNKAQSTVPLATFTAAMGTRYHAKADGTTGEVTINGNVVHTYSPTSFTVGGPLSVLASQSNGSSAGNYGYHRFYSLTITNSSGTPVVNLVPAERASDGVIGVYDTVRNVFKTNAGSGTFLCGRLVPTARALWTNAGGDGDISSAANWNCTDANGDTVVGALPDANTPVVFAGNFAVQIPTNTPLACSCVLFASNATLTANCDWRGLGAARTRRRPEIHRLSRPRRIQAVCRWPHRRRQHRQLRR